MSTELLTRRMDLIHTLTQDSGSSGPAVNHLTMDTSYPVKVKGIILKEYIATATLPNFPYSSWHKVFDVKNQNNEVVAQFTADQCFNFDGDPLDSLPDVGEYVMALIDLDANKIFIAPTNEIGGGSFKEFRRKIIEDDSGVLVSDADPIIDMKSIDPISFYRYTDNEGASDTNKKQYPDSYYDKSVPSTRSDHTIKSVMQTTVTKLKTKKGKASGLFLTQKKTDKAYTIQDMKADEAHMYFLDIDPSKLYESDNIDPQPTLYAASMTETESSSFVFLSPVDTNAPGTLKMYSVDLDREIEEIVNSKSGTSYNLLSRAVSLQQNNCMNYSFVRNNEDLVLYQFYPYAPKNENGKQGFAMAPVANVEIDDLNRLQSNVAVCAFMTPNGDSGEEGSIYDKYEGAFCNVLATQAIVQTIGNLSEQFRTRYSIPYSSDPASSYQSIMDRDHGSNPLHLTPYPGGFFEYIESLNELPKYYLAIGCADEGIDVKYDMQNIKYVPVRDIDNYISLSFPCPNNITINGAKSEINIEESDYAPYIITHWWSIKANGTKNYGFDILTNPSNGHLVLAGSGYGFFGSNSDQYPELSMYADPFDKTDVSPITTDRHCLVTYKMSDEIIEEIKTATGISEENCKKVIFNFRSLHLSKDLEDIVYKLDDSSHGTTFTSNIKLKYSQNNATFTIGTDSITTPDYTFEYEISSFDSLPYFINSNDEGRDYYAVYKIVIRYPHMVNFDTKEILYENSTVFAILKYTRATYAINGDASSIGRPIHVVNNLDVEEMHIDSYQLFEDKEFTTVVTKSMYQNYKTAGVDKTLYYYDGQNDDAHKKYGWYEYAVTFHFTEAPTSSPDIQRNDVFYKEILIKHLWNADTSTWRSEVAERNKYDIKCRGVRLFPYAVAQVVPSCAAFYQPTCPYPRVPKANTFPPRPDTQYGIDFQKWFKTIECWKLFDRDETTALHKMSMYNRGIDEQFIYTDSSKTKYRSLYDFMYDLFTKDVGNGKGIKEINDNNRNFESINVKMSFFDANTAITWQAENKYTTTAMYKFNVTSEHPHGGIDTYLRDKTDPSIDYSVNEANRINVAKVTTGLKKVTALSLTDENGDKLLLTGTGIEPIEADTINWKDLLLGLSTNKSVDIAGPLVGMKHFAKSNRKVSEVNRQSNTGYAMIYNADGSSTGMAIEGYDRYQWARSFWSDPMLMNNLKLPIYWYIDSATDKTGKYVETILPVISPILGVSFKGLRDICDKYNDGDPDPVRYEVFMVKTRKEIYGGTGLAFYDVDTVNGLTERLASKSITTTVLFIAGQPARVTIDVTNHRFFIKSGFQEIFGRKYFYATPCENTEYVENMEGRRSPMATGFFRITQHHSTSTASKVSSVFANSDSRYSDDYVDGLYYSTVEEGILRSTTRVLTFRWEDVYADIGGGTDNKVPIYNPSATGYANLYTDMTINSDNGKEFVCEFDAKGRITSMTVVGSDPTF